MEIAREGNRYLNQRAPWQLVKESREEAATVLYNSYRALKALTALLYPVIPSSAERLWSMMGLEPPVRWPDVDPAPGVKLGDVEPLFRKIDRGELDAMLAELKRLREERWSKKYPWEQAVL
ncbi:MAG: hypothetical protein RXO32_08540 [Thermoproteus sp.]